MSDSVRPHRRQPTRLPRPWDSPGKNTGVGCHFLLQCMKVKSESEVAQLCPTLSNPMDCSLPGSSFHCIFQARVLEWSAIAFSNPVPYFMANRWGSNGKSHRLYFLGLKNHCGQWLQAWNLDICSFWRKTMTNLHSVVKRRDITLLTKVHSQSYGFSSSHVWTWQLDHKEGCTLKNWCFSAWPLDAKSWLIWKDPDIGKDWRQEEKGITEDEMVRRHHWLNGHEFG